VKPVLAIVGPGDGASLEDIAAAERIAELAVGAGWAVSCGGRDRGVMAAAARGAARAGGVSVGLLPGLDPDEGAPELTLALPTGLGEARNALLAASCAAMAACGMNPGTASEVALALQAGKRVVLVRPERATREFYQGLAKGLVLVARSADEVITLLTKSN